MIQRLSGYTRTDTLLSYTPLFRSLDRAADQRPEEDLRHLLARADDEAADDGAGYRGKAAEDEHRQRFQRDQRKRELHSCLGARSEEHTSELQSLMRISYAVFCLKHKINKFYTHPSSTQHTAN